MSNNALPNIYPTLGRKSNAAKTQKAIVIRNDNQPPAVNKNQVEKQKPNQPPEDLNKAVSNTKQSEAAGMFIVEVYNIYLNK